MSDSVNWNELAKEPVAGTASKELKELVTNAFYILMARRSGFGDSILKRTRITEISLDPKSSEPSKKEATVVCELDVEEGGYFREPAFSMVYTLLTASHYYNWEQI